MGGAGSRKCGFWLQAAYTASGCNDRWRNLPAHTANMAMRRMALASSAAMAMQVATNQCRKYNAA